MPDPTNCPECEIIILTYSKLPEEADGVIHKCNSIESLYGTDYVKAKMEADADLHTRTMRRGKEALRLVKEAKALLVEAIEDLAS